ncbi:MAG: PAS domain S-box-containing protein [Halioglobus sp.]|jgi:PAS domain S-box-containing protein
MRLNTSIKYMLAGMALGLCFPLACWSLDLIAANLTFSLTSLVLIHQDNDLHYIVDMAPFISGVVFLHLGKITQRANAELTQFIDTANAPIFGIDTKGRVNEWNRKAATLTGFGKEEVMGQDLVAGFITDEFKESVSTVLQEALAGKDAASFECPLLTKDGSSLEVLLNATTRKDTDNNIIGVIGVGQDITEQRRKESALNQAKKMEAVGQLAGGLAHDFNNLLSIISGNLRFLQADIGEVSAAVRELFEDAMSATEDGAELTQRLLSFSRNKILRPEANNVNQLIEKFSSFLSRTLGTDIEMEIELAADELFAKVDSSQFDNALLNLSINARDAMPEGGSITIRAARAHDDDLSQEMRAKDNHWIIISVADTGTGISTNDIEHVFEPFFTTKEVGRGSGLGLSMVYGFTQQFDGECSIESEPGKGTIVSMLLKEAQPPAATYAQARSENLLLCGSEVILVVEDEPRVRRVTSRDLRKLGYTILEAENAAVAKTIIESGVHIDMLFSDVLMPGEMDGRRLGLWAEEHYPNIRVVLTSGYSKSKRGVESGRSQSLPLVRKPYTIEKLAKQIQSVFSEK